MSNWLGSHWRWRVAMVCIAVALLGYGWWQAGRWTFRQVVIRGGSPAVYRTVHRDGSQTLEAFDWKTGRQWTLAQIDPDVYPEEVAWSVRVTRDGKSVVWRYDNEVHAVDIESPERRQTFRLPFDNSRHKLIGLSHDARLAVFQAVGVRRFLPDGQSNVLLLDGQTGLQPAVFILSVVDLKSGEIVSSREWGSSMMETNIVGADEFKSYLVTTSPTEPAEPVRGRWRLTEEGEWELLEQSKQFKFQYVDMVRETTGKWRLVEDLSSLPADTVPVHAYVFGTFDSGERFTANGVRDPRTFAGNFETKEVFEIGDGDETTGAAVTSDGSYAVISDRRDDILVYDLKTGKVIARDAAGSSRRNHLFGVGIGLLVLAVALCRMAMVEINPSWGMIDALTAVLAVEVAAFPIYTSFASQPLWTTLPGDVWDAIPSYLFLGVFLGGAITTGWYWAHGREWFPSRWLFGALWLVVLAIPPVLNEILGFQQLAVTFPYALAMALVPSMIAGLVASGLVAAVAVLFRPLGWSIRAAEESRTQWRFGLLQLCLLTASVGIALVLVQSMPGLSGSISYHRISVWPIGSFLSVGLVGLLFLRSRTAMALGVVTLALIGFAATYWYVETYVLKRWDGYLGEAVAAAGTTLAVVLPCWVLRRHGWRWTKVGSVEALAEAAA